MTGTDDPTTPHTTPDTGGEMPAPTTGEAQDTRTAGDSTPAAGPRDAAPAQIAGGPTRARITGGQGFAPMTDEELRAEVRGWLEENWTPDPTLAGDWWRESPEYTAWLSTVVDARWAVPRWPAEWFGRGLSEDQARIVEEEFARVGAPGACQDRDNLLATTVYTIGSMRLRQDLLEGILRNEVHLCLLYSEPSAGSDLAAVRTRAERDGEDWVVTGQKIWTSGATQADVGMLVARTDWDAPKHKGLTFFILPMHQDGIDIRPIHQITGESHFNEVFLTGVRIPADYVVGGVGNGWRVLQTALAYERLIMGVGAPGSRRGTDMEDLISLARRRGRLWDPGVRQDLAKVLSYRALNTLNTERATAALASESSTPLMSLSKLAMSRVLHEESRVRTALMGADGLLGGRDHPEGDDTNYLALGAFFTSIAGGTDQIQRTIIGERVLKLPKEPEIDRDVPFREVRAG